MSLLGESADYLLCDTDPESVADLRAWAQQWGRTQCHVEQGDGMVAVDAWLGEGDGPTLVHVDPFDPFASAEGGRSAIDLAGHAADSGAALVYWYGYDTPQQRGWPLGRLGELTAAALWCGDVLVTAADGATRSDGSLGEATTPGTGFGVVLANVTTDCHVVVERLGRALAQGYQGTVLPSGEPGALDVQVIAG